MNVAFRFALFYLSSFLIFTNGAAEKNSDETAQLFLRSLADNANLDLSVDQEYEDLRAELLAYNSALSSLVPSRKSLSTTPCWEYGGICIHQSLCTGERNFLTEIPGCRNKNKVCCFVNNKYIVKDMKDQGIKSLGLPWGIHHNYGGKGIVGNHDVSVDDVEDITEVNINSDEDKNSNDENKDKLLRKVNKQIDNLKINKRYKDLFSNEGDDRYWN